MFLIKFLILGLNFARVPLFSAFRFLIRFVKLFILDILRMNVYEGRSRFTRKNTAKVLSLLQGLQTRTTRKINYCQLFT